VANDKYFVVNLSKLIITFLYEDIFSRNYNYDITVSTLPFPTVATNSPSEDNDFFLGEERERDRERDVGYIFHNTCS
jgi:hypothetical protein